MGFLAFLGVCTGVVFLVCVGIRWVFIAVGMMAQSAIEGWNAGKRRLANSLSVPRKTTIQVDHPDRSIPLESSQPSIYIGISERTIFYPGQSAASSAQSDSEKMKTVIFNHGKCDICGKEFMAMQDDPVSPLHEVEWSINNAPKVKKNFCDDCLHNFIACTSPTNNRQGEAEAIESARKFWRFFGKK